MIANQPDSIRIRINMIEFGKSNLPIGGLLVLIALVMFASGCSTSPADLLVNTDAPATTRLSARPATSTIEPAGGLESQQAEATPAATEVSLHDVFLEDRTTASSQPEASSPQEPFAGAPACEHHAANTYHTLWNAELGCHYDHTHADDPHAVDDLFGTSAYVWMGGEISYPWQTFSDAGTENELKHGGYFWLVRTPAEVGGCSSRFQDGCITAFRALSHFLMLDHGARTRYHSYWFEAQACREAAPDDCGILRTGGWFDTGDLLVDDQLILDEPRPVIRAPRPFKLHYSNPFATWYPTSPFVRVSMEVADAWGLVNLPADEAGEVQGVSAGSGQQDHASFLCFGEPGCELNNSLIQPHIIAVQLPLSVETSAGGRLRAAAIMDPDGDGHADFSGFVDRHGRILVNPDGSAVQACDIGLDCIPLQIVNLHLGMQYQLRSLPSESRPDRHPSGRAYPAPGYREYDIYFDGQPSGWIQYLGP